MGDKDRSLGHPLIESSSDIQVLKCEENQFKSGELIYEIRQGIRGLCLIFLNREFIDSRADRLGSENDSRLLDQVFQQLNFETIVFKNFTANQIKAKLDSVRNDTTQLEFHDAFVAIFSSHGNENAVLGKDLKPVDVRKDIVDKFNNINCEGLVGKPKVFIISACRGDELPKAVKLNLKKYEDRSHLENQTEEIIPIYEDIMTCYSTVHGFSSLRSTRDGTWFGTAMAQIIAQHAKDYDLEYLLKLVQKVMREKCATLEGEHLRQSISWEAKGWRKLLYFNPGIVKE